jgi:hypothetical protein
MPRPSNRPSFDQLNNIERRRNSQHFLPSTANCSYLNASNNTGRSNSWMSHDVTVTFVRDCTYIVSGEDNCFHIFISYPFFHYLSLSYIYFLSFITYSFPFCFSYRSPFPLPSSLSFTLGKCHWPCNNYRHLSCVDSTRETRSLSSTLATATTSGYNTVIYVSIK